MNRLIDRGDAVFREKEHTNTARLIESNKVGDDVVDGLNFFGYVVCGRAVFL